MSVVMEGASVRYFTSGFIVLLLTIFSFGCAKPQKLNLITTPINKPSLILPKADVLTSRSITWVLITEDTVKQSFQKLKDSGRPLVFFATTDEGYENLGLNESDRRTWMEQQLAITAAYQRYYNESEYVIDLAIDELQNAKKQIDEINEKAEKEPSWLDWFKLNK